MRRAATLVLAMALAGCGGLPGGRVLSVTSSGLSYQAQPADDFSGTDSFTFQVDGQQVLVRFDGTNLTHGTVQVTILDASGVVVLPTTSLAPGTPPVATASKQGTAGIWTVRVNYSDADGQVVIDASTGH